MRALWHALPNPRGLWRRWRYLIYTRAELIDLLRFYQAISNQLLDERNEARRGEQLALLQRLDRPSPQPSQTP